MGAAEAARLGHELGHTQAMFGFIVGAIVGAVLLGGLTILTGGAALLVVGAVLAGGGAGALIGMAAGQEEDSDPKGPIITGSPNTFLGRERKEAARAEIDFVECLDHAKKRIAQGSSTVFINTKHASRRTDKTECDGKLREGVPTVIFGGETVTVVEIEPEVPEWAVTMAVWSARIGAVILTGGAILSIGVVATAAGFVGSYYLGPILADVGADYGGRMFGRRGAFWGGVAGGLLGSIIGGGAGAAGAARATSRISPVLLARYPRLTSTLARMPGRSPTQIRARMRVADGYYRSVRFTPTAQNPRGAFNRAQRLDKMSGIDFTRPVRVRTVRTPERVTQSQAQGQQGPGSFVAKGEVAPSRLGIGDQSRVHGVKDGSYGTRQLQDYTIRPGTRVLESTASPKNDFFSVGNRSTGQQFQPVIQSTSGGAKQTAIQPDGLVPVPGTVRPTPPSLLQPGTPGSNTVGTPVAAAPANPPSPTSMATLPVRGDGVYTPPSNVGTGAGQLGTAGTGANAGPPTPGNPGDPPP